MVLMAVPPEGVVTVVRWTLPTVGGAAAHGAGRQDALSRTAAAYRIHRGMYAGGELRSATGGDEARLIAAMTSWARSRRPSLARIRLTWVLAVAGLARPAGDLGVGQALRDQREHLAFPPGELARQPRVRRAHGQPDRSRPPGGGWPPGRAAPPRRPRSGWPRAAPPASRPSLLDFSRLKMEPSRRTRKCPWNIFDPTKIRLTRCILMPSSAWIWCRRKTTWRGKLKVRSPIGHENA